MSTSRIEWCRITIFQLWNLFRLMGAAINGERNTLLYWSACRLAEANYPPASWELLKDAARNTGLQESEITKTIDSAKKAAV